MIRRLLTIMLLALSVSVISCGDDEEEPPADLYLPQTSEDNVIENLQRAYRMRDINAFMQLLAADYQWYFDPVTREQLGIEFWTRTEDSLATAALFSCPEVKRIEIELGWPAGSAMDAGFLPPRVNWTKLFLSDVFLDIDIKPEDQETTTFRDEQQQQRFYFRRGRTNPPSGPADTLVYIVEWQDKGATNSLGVGLAASERVTWGGIKSICFHPTPEHSYLPQTSEDNVLENFQRAYRTRDATAYARLLAADFQFYFDPIVRNQLGIEFWTRSEDSLRTEQLFDSPEVGRIILNLDWPRGSAMNDGFRPPLEGWTKLFITDVFLDVGFAPVGQEVTTFRVEEQQQRFYFRHGRTYPPTGPGDTLLYIVEWRDQGVSSGGHAALARRASSWSGIKALLIN